MKTLARSVLLFYFVMKEENKTSDTGLDSLVPQTHASIATSKAKGVPTSSYFDVKLYRFYQIQAWNWFWTGSPQKIPQFCGQTVHKIRTGGGCQKIQNFCGHHIWKPPKQVQIMKIVYLTTHLYLPFILTLLREDHMMSGDAQSYLILHPISGSLRI